MKHEARDTRSSPDEESFYPEGLSDEYYRPGLSALQRMRYLRDSVFGDPRTDAFLHFGRFLESLCLCDGAHLYPDDVGDAVHWHQTMLKGQYR